MYEGPSSPGLTLLHLGAQFPAVSLCAGLVGAYIYVTPATDLPAQLPAGVEAIKLYDGLTGRYMTLAELGRENLDPNTYVAHKGESPRRCYVTEGRDGQCVCETIPATK